jgi:hypothetical protein
MYSKVDPMLIGFENFFFRTCNTSMVVPEVRVTVLVLTLISTSGFRVFDTVFS